MGGQACHAAGLGANRLTARMALDSPGDVDASVTALLRQAWERS
jgi:hypothetical protein